MNIDISAIERDIITQSEALAQTFIHDFANEGMAALKSYLATSRAALERWTGEMAQKEITPDEFKDLIAGQITTALLAGLEQSGLAAVEVDKFTNGVIDIVTAVIFDAAKTMI